MQYFFSYKRKVYNANVPNLFKKLKLNFTLLKH